MKKTIIIFSLIVFLVLSSTSNAMGVGTFKDVKETDWFAKDVTNLVNLNIIKGFEDGTFKPSKKVKVDEFLKLLVASKNIEVENSPNYWATNWINKAIELDFTYENEFADTKATINRYEMALCISRVLGDEEKEVNQEELKKAIKDFSSIPVKYQDAVLFTYSKGLITGYTDGTFSGDNTLTRAETSTVINRVINKSARKKVDIQDVKYTADGRAIRTTNLPSNYKDFEYILADIPNEAYEVERRSTYNVTTPKDLVNHSWYSQENLDMWCETVEDNLTLRTNVDYETIDYIWAEKLSSTYGDWGKIPQKTKEYVDWVKKNKIKISGDVRVEPSLTFQATGGMWVRAYIKFKIEDFDENKWVLYEDDVDAIKALIKKNLYYEGWVDIQVGTNNYGSDGSDLRVSSSDAYIVMMLDTLPPSLIPVKESLGW